MTPAGEAIARADAKIAEMLRKMAMARQLDWQRRNQPPAPAQPAPGVGCDSRMEMALSENW